MTVRRRGEGRGSAVKSTHVHYAVSKTWRSRDVYKVAGALFDRYEPRPDYRAQWRAEQDLVAARDARFVATLEGKTDRELVAWVDRVGGDERSFERDLAEDRVDWVQDLQDIRDVRGDFDRFHRLAEPVMAGRGLAMPVRESRCSVDAGPLDADRAEAECRISTVLGHR